MRIVSYNIRKAVGLDRRRDPERILAILREVDADIVVLQEADRRLGRRPRRGSILRHVEGVQDAAHQFDPSLPAPQLWQGSGTVQPRSNRNRPRVSAGKGRSPLARLHSRPRCNRAPQASSAASRRWQVCCRTCPSLAPRPHDLRPRSRPQACPLIHQFRRRSFHGCSACLSPSQTDGTCRLAIRMQADPSGPGR